MDDSDKQIQKLYEDYSGRFYAAAYAILQSREDAEDAVIETFVRLIENREKLLAGPPEKQAAYAKTILKNVSIDMIRRQKRHETEEILDDIPSGALSVEEIAEGNALFSRLVEFIRTMSEPLRQALFLRLNYNFTSKQIAKALGISVDAAKKRLSNAKKQIRQYLEEVSHNE